MAGHTETRKAWFLDRDGTIIEDRNYLSDPDQIVLLPHAAEALRAAQRDGYLLIVVTNQSGIARGYFTEGAADAVDRRLYQLLAREGVHLTRTYRCPHLPEGLPPYNIDCGCRKPKTGLFQAAIRDFALDPAQCMACGDKTRDIQRLPELGVPVERTGLIGAGHYEDLLDFYRHIAQNSK